MSDKNMVIAKRINELIRLSQFDALANLEELWVFGYGSLVWLPNFCFSDKIVGKILGYRRRFYQGNTTHRGRPGRPGRVATLMKDQTGRSETYGCAYKLSGREQIAAALEHLNMRESTLGGYSLSVEDFHSAEFAPIPALVYTATPENDQFTGEQSIEELSDIIANASGPTGSNVEYLFRLAEWQREFLPFVEDDHLYELTRLTKTKLARMEREKNNPRRMVRNGN
ncbi:Oidioi.mRNA.OKI2018_I69.chr2.g7566.t2.cds [Oikopleura dioica]|uniref:glutathione-specific gamma-glutamylcyclotransferase n=1 Tax=Oikopleura dioica TaxID=34765 RepID=A0ABN7TB74_OIKDI|nr:Oidioi.mRNA.OKI2018_I69.chr2.g7566.t2.cds [Oikopleura dioica]